MRKIDISVVIPAYNAAEFIVEALESVKNQTRTDYIREVIIVDDGSVDDTCGKVSEWKQKNEQLGFKVSVISEKNAGASSARNAGIHKSQGNFVAFLDADDIWDAGKLEIQCRILEDYPRIHVLGTGWKNNNRCPGKLVRNKKGYSLYAMSVKDELIRYWPSTPSILAGKSDLLEVGGFDETRRYAEDGDLLCRLAALRGYVYYTSEELVECGRGKHPFGEKGLSGNLWQMHLGFLQNVRNCRRRGSINVLEEIVFTLWEYVKLMRRYCIVGFRKLRKTL